MNAPRPRSIHRKNRLGRAAVEELSGDILGYLAQDPERMMRFFDTTGLAPESIRSAASQPGFAASMVDYLASDDRLLLAFAAERGRDPAEIEAIRQSLAPPGDEP